MRPDAKRRLGIRQFIVLWIGAIVLAFLLLCGGLFYVTTRFHAKTNRIFVASRSLQTNRAFEAAVIAAGRQDVLWEITGDARYRASKSAVLHDADALLVELKSEVDSTPEIGVMSTIDRDYQTFRQKVLSPVRSEAQPAQVALDQLLGPLLQHRQINQQQMDDTMREANHLDNMVDIVATALIVAATVLVIAGGVELWSRIFKPALLLARAARHLGGDLQVRAPVLRDDEMGDLARTFNSMAEAIGERERDRLRFVATVAHDLRNPLVVIGGSAHLLKNKDIRLTPEERARWLDTIEKSTHTLESMIDDLLDGVQAQTGQLAFDMQPLDLAALVGETVQEHAAATKTHLIRHDIALPCRVNGDRKRLERVVMNLLSNAIKYSPRGREVNVILQARGGDALLRVCDEGAGIAAEDLPRLFLPFSRLERTSKMASGTGLGLSSVKKIIEGHGGTITIQSTLDVGTTVEVLLPLLPEARETSA